MNLLSDVQVKKIAAFDISDSLDLHDPRFGNAGSTEIVCPTCNMRGDVCMGHHASLSLGIHMFHPIMYKKSQNILNSVCMGCGKNLVSVTKSKAKRCHTCDIVNSGDYIVYATHMYAAVRPNGRDRILAENIPDGLLPDGYIVSTVLVPPIHLRTPEDMEWSTDIQKLYEQLVQVVRKKKIEDVCSAYCKITGALRNEGVTGIMSGKAGIFRNLMMGKRVELSARAVIVGDPHMRLDQVAVPVAVFQKIKIKTTCNRYNMDSMKALAEDGRLWWEGTDNAVKVRNILHGMTFERSIEDGDFVMLNRQPSLSKASMTCFRAVMRRDDQSVFAINPQVTPPFNADFDGDEMNIFFMSQSSPTMCRAEMVGLCSAENHVPVQDVVTGCYIMSKVDVRVSNEVWNDCVAIVQPDAYFEPAVKSTHGLLGLCIPRYKGEVLLKKNIMSHVQNQTACTTSVDLFTLQLVVERWMSVYGLTVSLSSVLSPPLKFEREGVDAYKERCLLKVQKDLSGTGLMNMIESGAKGSATHASHMAIALGQQYVGGKEGIFCTKSYSRGLTPKEFFGHQMAAREGVVSTNIGTSNTGYLNRRACKIIADLKLQYNNTVADDCQISSFKP